MNLRTRIGAAALVACLFGVAANAQKGLYRVYGTGNRSCGSWTKSEGVFRSVHHEWALGFLSGAGYAGESLRDTDSDGIQAWLTRYCEEHPVTDIDDAMGVLV